MRGLAIAAGAAMLACSPGPRALGDPEAELDEPVTVWTEELGRVDLEGGAEDRIGARWLSISLVPEPIACERAAPEVYMSFDIAEDDLEGPADNTQGGNPITVVYTDDHASAEHGEDYASATRGWVRIDERTDDSSRGAMSWVSEDAEGTLLAWAEGAFTIIRCDWRR